jgi:hypothetical protein
LINEDIDLLVITLENYLEESIKNREEIEKVKNECDILINGIKFDLRTPLIFLYLNFSYLDGFLYIIIN